MSAFWGLLLVGIVASVTAWLLARGGHRHAISTEQLEEIYKPSFQPEPPPLPKLEPVVSKAPTIALRLVSEAGRTLKTVEIPARQRRPAFRYSVNSKTVWLFNAETELEPGVWVYRRVGKERT